jgi:hypothetical protein
MEIRRESVVVDLSLRGDGLSSETALYSDGDAVVEDDPAAGHLRSFTMRSNSVPYGLDFSPVNPNPAD